MEWTSLVVIFFVILHTTLAPDCSYRYEVQPASIFTCNPYPLPSKTITLRCSVDYFSNVPSIQVEWYGSLNINQNTPMVLTDILKYRTTAISGISFDPMTSRNFAHFSTDLTITNLTDTDAGQYWCQISLTNSSQLESSEAISLEPEASYTNDPECTSSQAPTIDGTVCAMLLDTSNPVTTTGAISTTTPSSVTTQPVERTTTTSMMITTDLSKRSSTAIIVAVPTVVGMLLLLGVVVGVCACIIVTRHCKRKNNCSLIQKIRGKSNSVRERPLPPTPIQTMLDSHDSHRYDTPTLSYRSYELNRNPAYVANSNYYLRVVEEVEHTQAEVEVSGESIGNGRDYAVADPDMERSDEPYYVDIK